MVHLEMGSTEVVVTQDAMLMSQAKNLENLCLSNSSYTVAEIQTPDTPRLRLPVMANLKSLVLYLKYPDQGQFPIIPIQPYQVPKLHFIETCPTIIELGVLANSVFTSVTELKVQGVQNCGQLHRMATRFPNALLLRNLNTCLEANPMHLIATSWPELGYLEITFLGTSEHTRYFNLVISGIPIDIASGLEDSIGLASLLPFIDPPERSLRDLKCKCW